VKFGKSIQKHKKERDLRSSAMVGALDMNIQYTSSSSKAAITVFVYKHEHDKQCSRMNRQQKR
jgi:hypothetical protein